MLKQPARVVLRLERVSSERSRRVDEKSIMTQRWSYLILVPILRLEVRKCLLQLEARVEIHFACVSSRVSSRVSLVYLLLKIHEKIHEKIHGHPCFNIHLITMTVAGATSLRMYTPFFLVGEEGIHSERCLYSLWNVLPAGRARVAETMLT